VGTHGGPRDASVVDFSRRAPGLGVLEALDDDESARHLFMKRKDYGHKLRAYSSRYLNSAASSNNKRQLFVSHERAGSRRLKKARRRRRKKKKKKKKKKTKKKGKIHTHCVQHNEVDCENTGVCTVKTTQVCN
jgi:hypothetical protein